MHLRLSSRVGGMLAVSLLCGCTSPPAQPDSQAMPVVHPRAISVTAPVPVEQVEDAAVWIHPTDPPASLLLVTNKAHGLEAHRADGLLLKHYDDGAEYRGVDVVYGVQLSTGPIDVAVAAVRGTTANGIRVWRIDPVKSKLTDVTAGGLATVLDGASPLGIAAYHSRRTGRRFVFVSSEAGAVEQDELIAATDGKVNLKKVRAFERPGKVKGIVADDDAGVVYVVQEKAGVFRYPAEPDAPTDSPVEIVRVGDHGLVADLTGAALYRASSGAGYLLIVSQSPRGTPSTVGVFDRRAPNGYVGTIAPSSEGFHAPYGASGITATNRPTVSQLPAGFLAIKDRLNPDGIEDFKIYPWPSIAVPLGLKIDPQSDDAVSRATTGPAPAE
jgi:3-phytase